MSEVAEALDAGVHDRLAVGCGLRPPTERDNLDAGSDIAARGCRRFQLSDLARGKHQAGTRRCENARRQGTEGTGRTRHDGYFAANIKKARRILEELAHFGPSG